jgi:hypothetical protein
VITTESGPNDASGVVWALGVFFLFLFSCFFILNGTYRLYCCIKGTEGLTEGDDDEIGPKRRWTRRLGPRYVFYFNFRVFLY